MNYDSLYNIFSGILISQFETGHHQKSYLSVICTWNFAKKKTMKYTMAMWSLDYTKKCTPSKQKDMHAHIHKKVKE